MKKKSIILFTIIFASTIFCPACATTQLDIIKYAEDGSTILGEDSADYKWMEQNLPVKGDGRTHYYVQGPTFEAKWSEVHPDLPYDMWNPQEDINYEGKDLGAIKGTSLKDICDLAGGMNDGDVVRVQAQDGFYKDFPYENVYSPSSVQGEIVVAWYSLFDDGNGGYVPEDYSSGMRLVFLADTSVNPTGDHVFGATDMKNSLPDEYCHYFNGQYPAPTGLSVQGISRIIIYSDDEAPPGKITIKSEPKGAEVYLNEEYMGTTDITIEDLDDGDYEISVKLDGYKMPEPKSASVTPASETFLEFILEENFSGYAGHELKRFKKSEVKGNLNIFYSKNEPFTLSQGKTKEITLHTGIDCYDNVTYSRLWIYTGDSHNRNDNSGLKPEISLIAGGKSLMAEKEYFDRKDDGDRKYSATFAYSPDISGIKKPEIKLEISNSGANYEDFTVYGAALLTEETSGNVTTLWEGYEGCDIIWPGYETGDGAYYSYASPDDPETVISEAEVTCIATAIKKPSPEEISFEFNGGEWSGIFADNDYGLLNRTFDVFLFLDGTSTSTGLISESSSSDKGYIENRNLIFSSLITDTQSGISGTADTGYNNSAKNSGEEENITGSRTADNESSANSESKSNNTDNIDGDNNSEKQYPDYCDRCTDYKKQNKGFFESVIAFFTGIFTANDNYEGNQAIDCSLCEGYQESRGSLKPAIGSAESDETKEKTENGIILIDSVPKGALIYIDGTYTGKITPCSFGSYNIDNHILRLEKEGFNPYETTIDAEDEVIKPTLNPSDAHIAGKTLHSAEYRNITVSDAGSLYISGPSKNLYIFIDNRDTSKKTPAVISGLKPGTHTVRLKSYDDSGSSSESIGSRKVYVHSGSITPVYIPDSDTYSGKVSFVSDSYNKMPVSVNGIYQNYKIPVSSDEIYYDQTYLCIDDNGKYISYYIPSGSYVEGKFDIHEYTGKYYEAYFDSEPKGADIFIDGFDTGFHTPIMLNNLSTGQHNVVISKPGYLPATGKVMIPEGEDESFAGVIKCQLDEYPAGSVFADTVPSGAKVYINDVYTGEKTPVTIPFLNIGTYEFKFVNGTVKSKSLKVTVNPFEKTEIIEDM